ncbi:MAG: GreA/GreB family elongation factor [Vicingaceae bacterium]
MSRGFVKEDDQEEAPFIPPRAPLPPNTPNYVTRRGLSALEAEKEELEQERANLEEANESERRKALAVINGKLALLEERIQSAQLIKGEEQVQDEVRFAATVTSLVKNGKAKGLERTFTIVGVDESNVIEKRIAFTAPIVKVLMGKKVGEEAQFKMGAEEQLLEVTAIKYQD